MKVSFLIPVFSEVDSVQRTVEVLEATCASIDREILLLVHRASIPACRALCDKLAREIATVRVHEQVDYPGQGFAFREGFEIATGTHFLMMNADLETDPRDAARLIETAAQTGADLVVASRWMPGASVDLAGYGALRALVTISFQRALGRMLGASIHELTFSYKIGTRVLFERFAWEGTGHELSMETTVRPIAAGMRVVEIPTSWIARTEGRSNHAYLRNLRHAKLALAILLGERASRARAEKKTNAG